MMSLGCNELIQLQNFVKADFTLMVEYLLCVASYFKKDILIYGHDVQQHMEIIKKSLEAVSPLA